MPLQLPPLNISLAIVDRDGRMTTDFQRQLDEWRRQIEAQEAQQAQTIEDLTAAIALLNLVNSTPTGLTISAADVGSTATVTISAHSRLYGSGSSVAVSGGTVTGQPFSTLLFIYYDDASRAGGAVSYQATTSFATANPSQANPNRHFVGNVTTPADGAASTTGEPSTPPTYGGGGAIP